MTLIQGYLDKVIWEKNCLDLIIEMLKQFLLLIPPPPLQINYFIFCRWINLENGLQAILISDLLEGEEEAEEAPWDDEDEEEHDGNDETEMEEDEEEEDSENEEGGEKKVQF